MVNMLLEAGADPHKSPDCLFLVVMNDLADSLRYTDRTVLVRLTHNISLLIEKAKDPAFVNSRNDDGATALLVAAALGKTAMVTALIANGADVSIATNDGTVASYPLQYVLTLG